MTLFHPLHLRPKGHWFSDEAARRGDYLRRVGDRLKVYTVGSHGHGTFREWSDWLRNNRKK